MKLLHGIGYSWLGISWRGWHLSPLFHTGNVTFWFVRSLSVGYWFDPGDWTFFIGPLTIMIHHKWNDVLEKRLLDYQYSKKLYRVYTIGKKR